MQGFCVCPPQQTRAQKRKRAMHYGMHYVMQTRRDVPRRAATCRDVPRRAATCRDVPRRAATRRAAARCFL